LCFQAHAKRNRTGVACFDSHTLLIFYPKRSVSRCYGPRLLGRGRRAVADRDWCGGIMFLRIFFFVAVLALTQTAAYARRVALVIGQNAYSGGNAASIGLPALDNPARDAGRMLKLLQQNGFEVIACDGKTPGCFDLNRARFLDALKKVRATCGGRGPSSRALCRTRPGVRGGQCPCACRRQSELLVNRRRNLTPPIWVGRCGAAEPVAVEWSEAEQRRVQRRVRFFAVARGSPAGWL
jgi:hypothetical protein